MIRGVAEEVRLHLFGLGPGRGAGPGPEVRTGGGAFLKGRGGRGVSG